MLLCPNIPPSPSSPHHRVHKSALYVCVSIVAVQLGNLKEMDSFLKSRSSNSSPDFQSQNLRECGPETWIFVKLQLALILMD